MQELQTNVGLRSTDNHQRFVKYATRCVLKSIISISEKYCCTMYNAVKLTGLKWEV